MASAHSWEHPFPLVKSAFVQNGIGLLYASMQPSGTCADVMSWKLASERAEAVVAMHKNAAPRNDSSLLWFPMMEDVGERRRR